MNLDTHETLKSLGFIHNPNAEWWTHCPGGTHTGRYMSLRPPSRWCVETKFTDEGDHPSFDCPIAAAVYLLMQDPDQQLTTRSHTLYSSYTATRNTK